MWDLILEGQISKLIAYTNGNFFLFMMMFSAEMKGAFCMCEYYCLLSIENVINFET